MTAADSAATGTTTATAADSPATGGPIGTPTTRITRLAELASTERAALDQLLDTVHIGHFGLIDDGHPVVIATAIVRDGERILAHGSTGSRWMRALAAGAPTSLAVTAFDGLVVARSAFESSMHYRSAVLFGRCAAVTDTRAAVDIITEALLPGRTGEVREPTIKELAATLVLELPITRWSLKISDGWPDDPPADVEGPSWAGVLPARLTYGPAVAAPDLQAGIDIPPSVLALR